MSKTYKDYPSVKIAHKTKNKKRIPYVRTKNINIYSEIETYDSYYKNY